MRISDIVDTVNRGYIASDYLRDPDIFYYMDMVIDDINDRLNAKFPTFTEWKDFVHHWNDMVLSSPMMCKHKPYPKHVHPNQTHYHEPEKVIPIPEPTKPMPEPLYPLRDETVYDAFPDKYLRSVVALGVAVKFYTRDEEGEQVALDYQNRYEAALFKMTRDYHNQVPPYFQDNEGGYIDFTHVWEAGPRDLIPRGMVLNGDDTRIL